MTPARPSFPSRPVSSRSGSPPGGWGWIALLLVFCSVVASAATCFVMIRFSLVTPAKIIADDAAGPLPAASGKKSAPVVSFPHASAALPPADDAFPSATDEPLSQPATSLPAPLAPTLAQPRAVASSALDIVTTVLANTSYVGPNNAGSHQGLYDDLSRLRRASEAVARDDGSDPSVTAPLTAELARALDTAIERTYVIANRATETDASRQINTQMNAAFRQIRSQ